ncbi:MAG: hypothetical protein AB2A00_14195 [Myxococcota bacterium]
MNITFTPEELRVLTTALGIYLSELRNEVVHTEDRAYRRDILKYEGTLETLRRRFQVALSEQREAPDTASPM